MSTRQKLHNSVINTDLRYALHLSAGSKPLATHWLIQWLATMKTGCAMQYYGNYGNALMALSGPRNDIV